MLSRIPVSRITGDLAQLNAAPLQREIDLLKLNRRMQGFSGPTRLSFCFGLESPGQNPLDVLIVQPLEDPDCFIAVEPDIRILVRHALERFENIPLRFSIISDQAAIKAWVRGLHKQGIDYQSIHSADIDHYPDGRAGQWGYDSSRVAILPPNTPC